MGILEDLQACIGFEWDDGNSGKNLDKHDVSDEECEEIFFDNPLVVGEDITHSQGEQRGYALGQTSGRLLFVVFTVRRQLVRVISARDMTPAERRRYRR